MNQIPYSILQDHVSSIYQAEFDADQELRNLQLRNLDGSAKAPLYTFQAITVVLHFKGLELAHKSESIGFEGIKKKKVAELIKDEINNGDLPFVPEYVILEISFYRRNQSDGVLKIVQEIPDEYRKIIRQRIGEFQLKDRKKREHKEALLKDLNSKLSILLNTYDMEVVYETFHHMMSQIESVLPDTQKVTIDEMLLAIKEINDQT